MGGPGSGNTPKGRPSDYVPRPQPRAKKERKCLRCQKMFMSNDSSNRICPGCKGRQDHGDSGIPTASVNVGIPED